MDSIVNFFKHLVRIKHHLWLSLVLMMTGLLSYVAIALPLDKPQYKVVVTPDLDVIAFPVRKDDSVAKDVTAPVLTLNGNSTILHVRGAAYIEPGAVASDDVDSSVAITIQGQVDVNVVGTYRLRYIAVDRAGNRSIKTRVVLVVNNQNFANQYAERVLDYSSQYTEESGAAMQILGIPDTFVYGDAPTSWTPNNANNEQLEYITVQFPRAVYGTGVTIRETYGNGFVTRVDAVDLEGELRTVWTGDDTSPFGAITDFFITWDITTYPMKGVRVYIDTKQSVFSEQIDSIELHGIDAKITRNIIAPIITLNGAEDVSLALGTPYVEAGAIATDDVDGDLPVSIDGIVDADQVGDYTLTYTAVDAAGNKATTTRTVSVSDQTAPLIVLNGETNLSLALGLPYVEAGATATDNLDTVVEVVISGSVDGNAIGEYIVTYSAEDAAGNKAEETRVVTISDQTAPTLVLSGEAIISLVFGTPYIEAGATATDNLDTVVEVVISGSVDVNVVGEYELIYTAKDVAGNESRETRLVKVVDDTAPVITLNGDQNVTLSFGAAYTEAGATALDNADGKVPVTISGSVNVNAVGDYTLTYRAEDASGNQASETRLVKVVDNAAPVIVINGAPEVIVEFGEPYVDAGATATDNVDNAVTVTTAGDVNVNQVGEYILTYSAEDSSGNQALVKTRKVIVSDTTPPVIVVSGAPEVIVEFGEPYVDAGATATDNVDNAVTVTTVGDVNVNQVGEYILTYSAEDSSGNQALAKTRKVIVSDTTPPVIVVSGASEVIVEFGEPYVDAGATATDNVDNAVTVTTVGDVNVNQVGEYILTYSAEDSSGNQALVKTRKVIVSDTTPPVIVVSGASEVIVEFGEPYVDAGATATDNVDNAVTVTTAGDVNVNQVGEYILTYSAEDSSGNQALTKTRKVIVSDTTPPVIVVSGASEVIVEFGEPYVDAGATATDNVDNAVTVTTVGDVNVNQVGEYILTYSAEDSSGNQALAKTRKVIVSDTTPPVIVVSGASEVIVEFGEPYVDAGATATDNVDNAVTVTTAGDVNVNQVGEYILTYSAEDSSGNQALAKTRKVEVVDTTPPMIELNGSDDIKLTVGDTYTEEGATAIDAVDGVLTAEAVIVPGGVVDTTKVSVYTITYTATDKAGNAASVTRSVTVGSKPDTTPPMIELNGSGDIKLTVGDTYTEEGATAIDAVDGVLTAEAVIVPGGVVDTTKVSVYTITYTATDKAGNAASVTRSVTVESKPDTTPPMIELNGSDDIKLTVGDTYTEEGATAIDAVDGVLTAEAVIVPGGVVDTTKVSVYTITYTATDKAGNAASVTRSVTVGSKPDTTPPMIELNGSGDIKLTVGDTYTEEGATAIDAVDGVLTAEAVIVPGGVVDTTKVSVYTITYTATDKAGNAASVTRSVIVEAPADMSAPVITLNGNATITLIQGDSYNEQGATAVDDVDTSVVVTPSGMVDTNVPDPYIITYTATDAAGNTATATRTITVISNTIEEQISVNQEIDFFDDSGVSVLTEAVSFVDQAGNPVTDIVDLVITLIGINTTNPPPAGIPPKYENDENDAVTIYGVVDFAVTENGDPVEFEVGGMAEVSIPLFTDFHPDGTKIVAGDELPIWTPSEDGTQWQQTGLGIVVDLEDTTGTGLGVIATVDMDTPVSVAANGKPPEVEEPSPFSIDTDGDLTPDINDEYPDKPEEHKRTLPFTGDEANDIGNNLNDDDDGDGVGDSSDAAPLDPTKSGLFKSTVDGTALPSATQTVTFTQNIEFSATAANDAIPSECDGGAIKYGMTRPINVDNKEILGALGGLKSDFDIEDLKKKFDISDDSLMKVVLAEVELEIRDTYMPGITIKLYSPDHPSENEAQSVNSIYEWYEPVIRDLKIGESNGTGHVETVEEKKLVDKKAGKIFFINHDERPLYDHDDNPNTDEVEIPTISDDTVYNDRGQLFRPNEDLGRFESGPAAVPEGSSHSNGWRLIVCDYGSEQDESVILPTLVIEDAPPKLGIIRLTFKVERLVNPAFSSKEFFQRIRETHQTDDGTKKVNESSYMGLYGEMIATECLLSENDGWTRIKAETPVADWNSFREKHVNFAGQNGIDGMFERDHPSKPGQKQYLVVDAKTRVLSEFEGSHDKNGKPKRDTSTFSSRNPNKGTRVHLRKVKEKDMQLSDNWLIPRVKAEVPTFQDMTNILNTITSYSPDTDDDLLRMVALADRNKVRFYRVARRAKNMLPNKKNVFALGYMGPENRSRLAGADPVYSCDTSPNWD